MWEKPGWFFNGFITAVHLDNEYYLALKTNKLEAGEMAFALPCTWRTHDRPGFDFQNPVWFPKHARNVL